MNCTMNRWHPNMSKLPCDGKSCPNYRTDEDGKHYCDFLESLYGKWFEIGKISCPRKIA